MEGMFLELLLCADTSIWGHVVSGTDPVWGCQTRAQVTL